VNRLVLKNHPGMANTSVTVINLEGELDTNTVSEFETLLKELFNQKRFKIVLDMKSLTYISSSGFGMLAGVIQNVRANKGDIKIADVPPEIKEVLQMLEFHIFFKIFKTEDEAVRAF
jgi:anti-sigma B factor antagonist